MMENKEKKALCLDEMEKAAGGVVVEDEANKYWIVRQDGTVVAPVQSLEDAVEFRKVSEHEHHCDLQVEIQGHVRPGLQLVIRQGNRAAVKAALLLCRKLLPG